MLTGADEPVFRALGNGLLVAYVVDTGDALQVLQYRHLAESGFAAGELHIRAVENLLGLAREKLEVRSCRGVFVALMGGNFEASLLIVDRIWDETLAHLVPNGFVAAVPARDILAFCDIASQAGIAELRAIVARAETLDHPLIPTLLCRQGASWIRYED